MLKTRTRIGIILMTTVAVLTIGLVAAAQNFTVVGSSDLKETKFGAKVCVGCEVSSMSGGADHLLSVMGNVGIGTTAPNMKLTGYAAGAETGVYTNWKNDSHEILMGVDGAAIVSAMTASDLQLRTNNATRMTIQANTGNIGIGTTAPAAKLDVTGGDTRVDVLKFKGEGGDSGLSPQYYGIHQESGPWTHPYPDLKIAFHTGIKYDAHYVYGGHRFYTGYDGSGNPTDMTFSVGDGDQNVRVTNSLFAGAGITTGEWFRNSNSGQGLYNNATGVHWYSNDGSYWQSSAPNGIIIRNGHNGPVRGYLYADGTSFGLLSPDGNWKLAVNNSNTAVFGGLCLGGQCMSSWLTCDWVGWGALSWNGADTSGDYCINAAKAYCNNGIVTAFTRGSPHHFCDW